MSEKPESFDLYDSVDEIRANEQVIVYLPAREDRPPRYLRIGQGGGPRARRASAGGRHALPVGGDPA